MIDQIRVEGLSFAVDSLRCTAPPLRDAGVDVFTRTSHTVAPSDRVLDSGYGYSMQHKERSDGGYLL